MLWANASPRGCEVTLPLNEWVQQGTVVLSTDPENPIGQPVKAGQTITVSARSLVLLQEN
jgi:glycogen operon protein